MSSKDVLGQHWLSIQSSRKATFKNTRRRQFKSLLSLEDPDQHLSGSTGIAMPTALR